jgi:hypothetical protein
MVEILRRLDEAGLEKCPRMFFGPWNDNWNDRIDGMAGKDLKNG